MSAEHCPYRYRGRYSPIGLDLGSAFIKMLQLRRSGGGEAVHCLAAAPAPAGALKNGRISSPGLLAERLKQLRLKHPWHKNRVNICLGLQSFYLRRVKLPAMKEAERARAMRWEVEKHFPVSAEDAVFDYCPLESEVSGALNGEYLLAAAAKDTADSYTETVASAGFIPAALEIEPISLLRALNSAAYKTGRPLSLFRVLLNIGFERSALLVSCGGEYQFHRLLNTGLKHFYRSAAEKHGCSFNRAHRLVFSGKPLAERGLFPAAEQLAGQAAQSISYWFDQAGIPDVELHEFNLCGGGAFIPGLAAFLKNSFPVKPGIYDPLTGLNINRPAEPGGQTQRGALFAGAYGLALRGWLS